MRTVLLGFVMVLTVSSAAVAKDLIVVSSGDPSVKVGQSLDAGASVSVGPGHSVTLMRPSGEILTLQGGPGGIVLPGHSGADDDGKFSAVQALFSRPPAGRTFGARRGFCPGPEVLDNIDAIVRSNQAGCKADARKALQDYLKSKGVPGPDAERLYDETILGSETEPKP